MEEYGTLKFNNGAHPGKCEIDDRNNIIVTVYESDFFKNIFENWWNLNKNDNFSMVIQQFYSPYIGRCLEEEFLANVRVIEELYELK